MTTVVRTPQARGSFGIARADITPPVGIYHRMWGAALHDRATGVHRPLTASALWMQSSDERDGIVLLCLDHCLLDPSEFTAIRDAVAAAVGIRIGDVFVAMSHTHGSAWMSRSRSHLPGGDLIGPYLDATIETCVCLAKESRRNAVPGSLVFGSGRCSLAAHRDYFDAAEKRYVCGYDPEGAADDTVMVAKCVSDDGKLLGTLVNYACHPTTLAWKNTLISPDYVGAMREVVESHTKVPCLFLQGASGDLGPREGFVGDTSIADRNGRQLGFAALSALEAIPSPGTQFEYAGAVVSGATLGTWEHRPAKLDAIWSRETAVVPLSYRLELPTEEQTRAELRKWEAQEKEARQHDDVLRISESRAHVERMHRQLARLSALTPGPEYRMPLTVARMGSTLWVFSPGELYQTFQIELRRQFPDVAVIVATMTNDWQPGYFPSASSYGRGIYQETIAAVAPGSLETLLEVATQTARRSLEC
ncbi:MAG: neutral/alkaline non-lysosomal ceramidase N-terminal domain-containing protein [Gemmataceae bacterium]|nr:neutral/alkaline non-lysosomal ceramidase N-terminal domain-containing protein [Gemmataceae bacterium]